MSIKKILAVTLAAGSLATVGTVTANAATGSYGDANVSWQYGFSGQTAFSNFLDRVAPPTTQISYNGSFRGSTAGAMQTASVSWNIYASTGATFFAQSSNYNASHDL